MLSIALRNEHLHAEVLPEAGAGLARLDWIAGPAPAPLLRPLALAPGAPPPTPSQLACFPMLPWANRIDPAGFEFDGRSIVPPPNRPGEPCPIHGDGWQYPWQVEAQSPGGVTLALDRRGGAPFAYTAQLRWELSGPALMCTASITNTGPHAMPFGFGLHPFFPRSPGVQLQARAATMWTSGLDKLPLHEAAPKPGFDFNGGAGMPVEALDNLFCGWDGKAHIAWPGSALSLSIEAGMNYYIVYAPSGADFFCFEPLDHAINAHKLAGGAAANGLSVLAPGQTLRHAVSFRAGAA